MAKRIIALLVTVFMLLGVSVISTSAATSYDLWVGGVRVTSQNANDVFGDGKVSFSSATNTLRLNNADIKGKVLAEDYISAGVYAAGMDLTVSFTGENKISDIGGCQWSMGIGVDGGDLILKEGNSEATLSVTSGYAEMYSVGIYCFTDPEDTTIGGDLTVNSGYVSVDYKGETLSDGHGMGVCAFDVTISNNDTFKATGAPSKNGYSYGINACGVVYVSGYQTVLRANGGDAVESHGLYSVGIWDEDENGDLVMITEANLKIDLGAKVYAQGGKGKIFSAGVNLEGGIDCYSGADSLTATGGDTEYVISGEDSDVYSRSYGITTFGNLNFYGGVVNATAGYAYDSCGINALTDSEYIEETDIFIPLKGDVLISGAKVSAVSKGGYSLSDGMYIGGDLSVTSGSLYAAGGVADATDKEEMTESAGIYANYKVSITGGTVSLACKPLANGSKASSGIIAYEPIIIGEDLTVKGAKAEFKKGDTEIVPKDFDTVVVIEKHFDGLLGDVNADGDVNIKDATAIQKHIAVLEILSADALAVADFNQDFDVSIKDATAIQKFIAGLPY